MAKRRPAGKLTIWKNSAGEFWWRFRARNGRIVDGAKEGYDRYRGCRTNLWQNGFGEVAPATWVRGQTELVIKVPAAA